MQPKKIPLREFLKLLPKAELHSHIDGCLRFETIIELCNKAGIKLPTYDPNKLAAQLYKPKYESLADFLKIFGLTCAVMKTKEALERVAYEYAVDYIKDGVYYLEGRFAPQAHVSEHIENTEDVLIAINKGFIKAASEHNSRPEVKSKQIPEFKYGIISCIIRNKMSNTSLYFNRLYEKLAKTGPESSLKKLVEKTAAIELVQSTIKARDIFNIPIVAVDLCGNEHQNPPEDFNDAFELARKNLFHVTVHAGEAAGAESIKGAITVLGAERIGHGFNLFTKPAGIMDEKYNNDLVEYLISKNILVEVCVSSNFSILKECKSISEHPVRKMIEKGVKVNFGCDNKIVLNTDVSKELYLAIKEIKIKMSDIKKAILNGFKKSFYFGTNEDKMKYIQEIKEYFFSLLKSIIIIRALLGITYEKYYDKIEKSYEISFD